MFEPDFSIIENNIRNKSVGLLTIGAMEQLGTDYRKFLSFMLKVDFKIFIHFETTYEDYDSSSFFDYLPLKYIEKRNWLRGYFNELLELQRMSQIQILEHRKTFGSFFHDGYTVTVWRKSNV